MNIKSFLVVTAVIFPLGVFAGDKSTTETTFKSLDTDKDGYISKQEAEANKNLVTNFKKIDADTDGKLEMSEISAFEAAEGFTPMEEENEPIGAAPTK